MKYLWILLIAAVFALAGCHEKDFRVFHWITPEPPPLEVEIQPEVVPEEEMGVVEPEPEPEPPCLLVKGNISGSGERIYHTPTGVYYDQVKIDEAAGEQFFCSEEEAVEAGFRPSLR